jgi:transporter family protein
MASTPVIFIGIPHALETDHMRDAAPADRTKLPLTLKRKNDHNNNVAASADLLQAQDASKYPQHSFAAMPPSSVDSKPATRTTVAGMPAWLAYSLLTIVLWGAWGAVSKIASSGVDANTNQIYFTLGLLPLMLCVLPAVRRGSSGPQHRAGIIWAFVTGLLGGAGNIAFFRALGSGGKVSIVAPATALFPLVTVILAVTCLRERLSRQQIAGFVLALVAIYLLTM